MRDHESGPVRRQSGSQLLAVMFGLGLSGAASAQMMCPGSPAYLESLDAEQQNPRHFEQQMLSVFEMTLSAYQSLPFETFQVAAAQQAVGSQASELFYWVRDNTRWLPYEGALRGAAGVMMDRMGSSLDRALLLAEMLEHAGYHVRLARSVLPGDQLDALYQQWDGQIVASFEPPPSVAEVSRTLPQLARDNGLEEAELTEEVVHAREQIMSLHERLHAQTEQQVAALLAEQALATVDRSDRQLASHWWVQWENNGHWENLDPSLHAHVVGDTLVPVESADSYHYADELPEEAQHWLQIDVVAEQSMGGELHEHIALSHRFPVAELGARQLRIETSPVKLPRIQNLLDGGDALMTLESRLLDETQWAPYIRVGDDVVRQQVINSDGSVEDPVRGLSTSAQGFSDATNILGGISLSGRGAAREEPEAPALTAVFLRMRSEAPGQETAEIERPLMDILTADERQNPGSIQLSASREARRAAQMLGFVELIAQHSWLPDDLLTSWRYEALLDSRTELLGVAYSLAYEDFSFLGNVVEDMSGRNEALDLLATLRFSLSPHIDRIALTRPNLLSYVTLVDWEDEEMITHYGFDILDNRVDVPSAEGLAEVRLGQGVFDTLLEAEIMREELGMVTANTALIFADDLALEQSWQWLNDESSLASLDWTPSAAQLRHYEQVLASGQRIVMPARAMDSDSLVWWQVNPQTGDTLGYGPHQRGQSLAEQLLIQMEAIDNAASAAAMAIKVWKCVAMHDDPPCCGRQLAAEWALQQAMNKSVLSYANHMRLDLLNVANPTGFQARLNKMAIAKGTDKVTGDVLSLGTKGMECSVPD